MLERTPEKRCPKGHLIPTNKTFTDKIGGGVEVSQTLDKNGNPLKYSRLICEECALQASAGMPTVSPKQRVERVRVADLPNANDLRDGGQPKQGYIYVK
jgi:hypothetical protein